MHIEVRQSRNYISEDMLKFVYLYSDTLYKVTRVTPCNNYFFVSNENGEVACVEARDAIIIVRDPSTYAYKAPAGVDMSGSEVIFENGKLVKEPGTEKRRFMYVIVRTDMELQNIIVQSAHAAYESGLAYKNYADRTTIIVLQVKSELYLREAYNMLQRKNIRCTMYKEHSLGLGYTAIGTEALTHDQRRVLKKYKLLKVK